MSYEQDITRAIKNASPLWQAIGGNFSWDIADTTKEPPYLVAQTINEDGDTPHDGFRNVTFPTVQFTSWAKTKSESIENADKIRKCLEGKTLPGASSTSFIFDSKNSIYDDNVNLFGTVIRFRAAAQI